MPCMFLHTPATASLAAATPTTPAAPTPTTTTTAPPAATDNTPVCSYLYPIILRIRIPSKPQVRMNSFALVIVFAKVATLVITIAAFIGILMRIEEIIID